MPRPNNRHRVILPYLVAGLILVPLQSYAADAAISDMAAYFRVIWGLLVVLGIILVLYGLLRKRFSLLATGTDKEIKVLEIKPLMGKKILCLVSVRGQEHLLGISGDRISHIAAVQPQPEASQPEASQPETSFAKILQETGATSQS